MIKLSASSIGRFKACPGAAFLDAETPENLKYNAFKDASDYGTKSHEVGELALKSGKTGKARTAYIKKIVSERFEPSKRQEVVDMIDLYCRTIYKAKNKGRKIVKFYVEEKFRTGYEFRYKYDMVFKADCFFISKDGSGRTYIEFFDLKSGNFDYAGDGSAFEQMRFSAQVYLKTNDPGGKIRLSYTVVQPRYWNASRRVVTQTEAVQEDDLLGGYYLKVLTGKLKKGQYAPSEKCKFCPSVLNCPKIQEVINEMQETNIETISPEKMEYFYSVKDGVETFFKALESKMIEAIDNGLSFRGWEKVKTYGNRSWINPAIVEERLAFLGSKRYTKPELLSVAQMEKIAGKENIADLYTKPEGWKLGKKEDLFSAVVK